MSDPAPRLYTDLAHLWPHLSPPEHYAEETELLRELIDQTLGEPPAGQRWSLLELGAGGGHSTVHLKAHYECTASDLSPQMLAHCEQLNPDVPTIEGDMRDMRLHKRFDAVLICDAIDYMTTREDAVAALATVAAHLRPGGIALFAPTYTRETFTDGEVADDGTTIPGIAGDDGLTYFSFVHDPDPADTQFEMILLYLMRDHETRQVQTVEDRHTCGLFSIQDWQAMADAAGLHVEALAEKPEHEANANDPAAWSVVFCGTV
ncbi:MAG: class I SAM-dependent methyltransferase [Phycisphaeraceae bacterium]|nr:class I SAM-dependent methyltransferase [Phycisphaeraceae bacterium]